MAEVTKKRLKIGFLINPYAGLGGEAGLKGSDGADIREKALDYHQSALRAQGRAERFCEALAKSAELPVEWHTASGLMGQNVLETFFKGQVIINYHTQASTTEAADTKNACEAILSIAPDLIIFVGGDGTARDVMDVVGMATPCLGVPAGVKMQSSVFAITPEAAADILLSILAAEAVSVFEGDVRDIDEAALRDGRVSSKYYGSMMVPAEPRYLQRLKNGGVEDSALVLEELSEQFAELLEEPDTLYLVGPGRTLAHCLEKAGFASTLVGFDAIANGELVQADANGKDIERLVQQFQHVKICLSPTGHQGFIIGRGNQQLTPLLLKAMSKASFLFFASRAKIASLQGRPLLIDSGDQEVDQHMAGLYNLITAYDDQVLYPVNFTYEE